jgi:hypothetical protein
MAVRFYLFDDHKARQQGKNALHRKLKKILAQNIQSEKKAPKKGAGAKIVGIFVMYNVFAKNLMIEKSLNGCRKVK